MNQLESLKQFTTIVADSGDIELIRHYTPQDTTTNPSLILKATSLSYYQNMLEDVLAYARKQSGNHNAKMRAASDKLAVNIGLEILKIIPGRISTEIDARFSFNSDMCINHAHKIVSLYQEQGINKSRVLIKLASTWEGIKAAEELEKAGINCNLTLIFSFAQARACAEANVYLISPFVGRIYDWYNQRKLLTEDSYDREDPGVKSVHKIYDYYKQHRYQTIVMGASFRKIDQILALAGCDYLTISPVLLEKLRSSYQHVERQLFPATKFFHKPIPLSESQFRWEHNQDAMAVDQLADGIRKFALDQYNIEKILAKKL
ncbi:transaldolase [Candidatus Palibaumannia cicadellinicola]|uniref:Transaldolase n=1 Tax=Baumannia cicadellinicola subsp. Homalodisca coagulata TaxID=374463 RepID=TAL_BAUCH|nr:transaldolase [Candidatus Baumannia cicadellinicola]Q1LU10.1 RecName: Full=Transaldolase [Baumannia cicadellinicola str. Hc (Homalodisca coagulata)]ABF13893.1 transaldolase [Baumannia cicadellinicola str. Hc (Homalodisca coagulata)]MBS0032612.1 transaldolase [Candidatus Baumannia cicadellinicola]MCJ7462463.1 transaldolase [Candidatus Baumannia cicadellinicola]MCJ7462660.1 transaldolase [Candidatus Baumannia cicadellinicola]